MKFLPTLAVVITALSSSTTLAGGGSSRPADPVTLTFWGLHYQQGEAYETTTRNACTNLPWKPASMTRNLHYYTVRLWEGPDCTGNNWVIPPYEESWYFNKLGLMENKIVSVSTCEPAYNTECRWIDIGKKTIAHYAAFTLNACAAAYANAQDAVARVAGVVTNNLVDAIHPMGKCRFCFNPLSEHYHYAMQGVGIGEEEWGLYRRN